MTQQELLERCVLSVLSAEHLSQCNTFDCGSSEDEQDLNDFFANDAIPYQQKLLGKTYLFRSRQNPKEIVTAFTLANDSIRLTNKLAEDERLEAKYVGIGIGRLPLHTRLMYFDLLNMEIVEE